MKVEIINPAKKRKSNPRVSRVRRNPRLNVQNAVMAGAAVLAGMLGARMVSKLVLGEKDSGTMGYVGQIAGALALAAVARTFGLKNAATLIGTGGVASVIWRGLADSGITWAQPGTLAEYFRATYPYQLPIASGTVAGPYGEYYRAAAA